MLGWPWCSAKCIGTQGEEESGGVVVVVSVGWVTAAGGW